MLEVGKDVQVAPGQDLLQHGVDGDVTSGSAHPSTKNQTKYSKNPRNCCGMCMVM
jgi:hypothetical protein